MNPQICTTHHHGCKCREDSLVQAYRDIKEAKRQMDLWNFAAAYRLIGEAKDRMEELGYGK